MYSRYPSYDTFAINIASVMLGYVYGTGKSCFFFTVANRPKLPSLGSPLGKSGQILNKNQDLSVKIATPIGTVVGQLLFGWLGNIVGGKRMYGIESIIIIIATFAQALSGGGHAVSLIAIWRFLMGICLGGDYPLSAIMSSEFAATRIRGRMMALVFSAQGWGNFAAALVALMVVAAYKTSILGDPNIDNPEHVNEVWCILIGLSCVPRCLSLYFHFVIPETPHFTMDIERNIQQASHDIRNVLTSGNLPVVLNVPDCVNAPKASWTDFWVHFCQWKNGKVLLGTSWSWFALDISFYGLSLNNSTILQAISFNTPSFQGPQLVYDNLWNTCVSSLIYSTGGLLPGYYFSFLFINSWGRKAINFMGFTMLTMLFVLIILGFSFEKLDAPDSAKKEFIVLYCFANLLQSFGFNTTTFNLPKEAFPTCYHSTAHRISAAASKLGAIVAQVGFAQLKDIGGPNLFVKHILEIFALFLLSSC